MLYKNESNVRNRRIKICSNFSIVSIIALSAFSTNFLDIDKSVASLTNNSTINVVSKADSIKAPTKLKVTNARVGETDLSWVASTSTYTTGYKVLRSNNIYGPWTQIGQVSGRTTVKFIDTNSAATSWFYRVESVYGNWLSVSSGYEAPPAVGRSFYDGFEGSAGNLDGRITEDGKSKWLVWSGEMSTADSNPRDLPGIPHDFAAYGTPNANPSPGNGDVAVVRTPATDAWVFASDFDGLERFIIRGKDPQNYIYVGGGGGVGTLQIGIVKNGVKEILTSLVPGADKNFRLEIKGNTISAYIDAVQNNPKSGTLYSTMTSTKFDMGLDATYFGIGFTRGGYGINDFTFEAL